MLFTVFHCTIKIFVCCSVCTCQNSTRLLSIIPFTRHNPGLKSILILLKPHEKSHILEIPLESITLKTKLESPLYPYQPQLPPICTTTQNSELSPIPPQNIQLIMYELNQEIMQEIFSKFSACNASPNHQRYSHMKNDNIADHALYDTLIQKIAETDCKNKRLLSLSATISKSSFFKQGSENNIVAELEQEIRTAFGEVITCLRTYFISISKELKNIDKLIQNTLLKPKTEDRIEQACQCDNLSLQIEIAQVKAKSVHFEEEADSPTHPFTKFSKNTQPSSHEALQKSNKAKLSVQIPRRIYDLNLLSPKGIAAAEEERSQQEKLKKHSSFKNMTLSFPKALFSNSAKYYGESAIGGSMGVLPVTIATNWDDSEQQESSFVWGYESKESGGREEEIVNSRERVR